MGLNRLSESELRLDNSAGTLPVLVFVAAVDALAAIAMASYPQTDFAPKALAFMALITAYVLIFNLAAWAEIRLDRKARIARFRSVFNFLGEEVAFSGITKVEFQRYRTSAVSFLLADGKRRAVGRAHLSQDEAKTLADFIGVPFENVPVFSGGKDRPRM